MRFQRLSSSFAALCFLSACSGPSRVLEEDPGSKAREIVTVEESPVGKMHGVAVPVPAAAVMRDEVEFNVQGPLPDEEVSVPLSSDYSDTESTGRVGPGNQRVEGREQIDLVTALRLAADKNLNVEIVREELRAAASDVDVATALFLPDLSLGVDYGRHDGRMQQTRGEVFDVSRSSLLLGPELHLHFDLGDAVFERLRAKQEHLAVQQKRDRTLAESIVQAAILYLDLLQARGLVEVAEDAVKYAQAQVELSERLVRARAELQVHLSRARARRALSEQRLVEARNQYVIASVELAVWLRLPPRTQLRPADEVLRPLTLVGSGSSLDELLATAMRRRPDVREIEFLQRAAAEEMSRARWSPWIPDADVFAGYGYFGGGRGSSFGEFDDRLDVGAGLSWTFRGFGFGESARYRRAQSELVIAGKRQQQLQDQIAGQVLSNWERIQSLKARLEAARFRVEAASETLDLVQVRFDAQDALQIELFEARQGLEFARAEIIAAIVEYNQAQHLLHYQVFGEAWVDE